MSKESSVTQQISFLLYISIEKFNNWDYVLALNRPELEEGEVILTLRTCYEVLFENMNGHVYNKTYIIQNTAQLKQLKHIFKIII